MRIFFTAVICGTLLSGCAFSPQLKKVAVDHDQMVAEATDEMMLRNIVRAKKRYPLHFTTISEVNGGVEVGAEVGLSPSFQGPDEYGPTASGSISTNPSFKMGVLDTKEFQSGIQKPIEPDLIAYYLDAGWPDALIMSLFVERVDLFDEEDPDKVAFSTIVNDPDSSYGFGGFLCDFALSAYKEKPKGNVLGKTDQFVIPGTGGTGPEAKARMEAVEKLLTLLKTDGVEFDTKLDALTYTPSGNFNLYFRPLEKERCPAGAGWRNSTSADDGASDEYRLGAKVQTARRGGVFRIYYRDGNEYDLWYFYPDEKNNGANCERFYVPITILKNEAEFNITKKCFTVKNAGFGTSEHRVHDLGARIVPRSIGDIIYFLGEYVRETEKNASQAYELPSDGGETYKVIEIVKGNVPKSVLSTTLDGERYSIPSKGDDDKLRSMQVITIVEQLLNLHKSADSLPRSISVTGL